MGTRVRCLVWLVLVVLATAGCHHRIAFEDLAYSIGSKQHDAGLVVVIDQATLNDTVSIRSFMTGIAHSWDAQPGLMLQQVAQVEFPQMFKHYVMTDHFQEASQGEKRLTIQLTVPRYAFADFRAIVTVRALAYGPGRSVLFDKTYDAEGISQGGKMFGLGAFGMKSAVRQSSFDAYKKIFVSLRADIANVL